MLKPIVYPSREAEIRLASIAARKTGADPAIEKEVLGYLESVRKEGDEALLRFIRRFDAPDFTLDRLTVTDEEMRSACDAVDESFLGILREAAANIEAFHRQQLQPSHFTAKPDGSFLGRMTRPVDAAGMYIPGGRGGETPLISSVLMNGIPAKLAGVRDLALITPPREDGGVDPHLLVAAREVGVSRVHKVGSAWGIAALAYGTESIGKVDVVVGPGNIYVALAKKLVAGEVGIDMLAGPSEILIIADRDARPDYVAADLLSQAEHDSMASAVLISTEQDVAVAVAECVKERLAGLPRRETARESLERFGAAFVMENLDAAVDLANRIAPEHLELQIADPWAWLGRIKHAGAVFLGDCTPEAVGDYFAGPNHVLPTAGTARFASALGVENFLKKTSVIFYSRRALERDGKSVIRLAELEGLEAHAASVRVRLE